MTYLTLFWTFFKIGLFTFGGGYAMLPLIQQYVLGFGWLSVAAAMLLVSLVLGKVKKSLAKA